MKIYISLPISGREKIARNQAEKVANLIKEAGHTPVNPFNVYAGENPDYFDHLCYDLRAMMDCDMILFYGKMHHKSCGCQIESNVSFELSFHKKKEFVRERASDLSEVKFILKNLK